MNIKRIPYRTEDLHPEVRFQFSALAEDLALAYQADRTEFLLEPFEGFRSIDRQRHLLAEGTTKAGPWESAHQFGLAVDFVPRRIREITKTADHPARTIREWYWPAAEHDDWKVLSELAAQHGLLTPITWDKPHVQHPYWKQIRKKWR